MIPAAVPAPAQNMLGASLCNFSQFLSATMLPAVALVSAAKMTASLQINPTMVVPVFVNNGYLYYIFSVSNSFLHFIYLCTY